MKRNVIFVITIMIFWVMAAKAQQKKYVFKIEMCNCRFMADSNFVKAAPINLKTALSAPFDSIDSSFKTKCGYLTVPENRYKSNSRMIKLPFIVVESKNPNKKEDPILYTAGGPGNSSLGWAIGATKKRSY
jgi:hypothetical protein